MPVIWPVLKSNVKAFAGFVKSANLEELIALVVILMIDIFTVHREPNYSYAAEVTHKIPNSAA